MPGVLFASHRPVSCCVHRGEDLAVKRRAIVPSIVLVLAVLAVLVVTPTGAQDRVRLTGSGASFPFPLYWAWFKAFSNAHRSVAVDYQAKGSGAGIQDFINHTVDFAASDAAMTDNEMTKVPEGVQLLPMTAGEIAIGYNLGAVKGLKLPR